ncbi:MAG: PEP-utilizing enzyme [Bdellovibrionota bacterium]
MSGDILWLKVSEEVSLPGRLTTEEQGRLRAVFDSANPASPWRKALARLSLAVPQGETLRFVNGVPYFNAGVMAEATSQGTVYPERGSAGEVRYRSRGGLWRMGRLLYTQWKLEAFLGALSEKIPEGETAIEESVALGLAVQLLLLRLHAGGEGALAERLADPERAPKMERATLRKVLAAQSRRTRLSAAWASLYTNLPNREAAPELAAYFWNEPLKETARERVPVSREPKSWKGIPICPGVASGDLVFPGASKRKGVLVFPHARPSAVEHFEGASGVVFAEGGALAHACCVAREMGIPAVSGVGKDFLLHAQAWAEAGIRVEIAINGSDGSVHCNPNNAE